MDDDHVVGAGEVHDPLHEIQIDAGRRRVVGERQEDDAGLGPRVLPALPQHLTEIVADRQGHLTDLRSREERSVEVDGVRRGRNQDRVTGLEQHPHQMREPFLGADGVDDLRLRVEFHPELAQVEVRDGTPELGNSPAERVAVVSRVAGRLGQLLHRHVGRWQIRVPDSDVDDVLAAAAALHLQPVNHGEDVGREVADAAELHRHRGYRARTVGL